MQLTLSYVDSVCDLLSLYEIDKHVVIDFGLINRMDYYSGIIFQGYAERSGKPLLTGGRYDRLGHEFGANIPAIGFACEIESIVKALDNFESPKHYPIDVKIIYDNGRLSHAIKFAERLRELNYRVITIPKRKEYANLDESKYVCRFTIEGNTMHFGQIETRFSELEELEIFNEVKGDEEWIR